jgi:hypothetical protein
MAESNRVAPERHIKVINVILTVGFPVCIADYPPATPETKLGETGLLPVVVFGAPVHMPPSLFDCNTNAIC